MALACEARGSGLCRAAIEPSAIARHMLSRSPHRQITEICSVVSARARTQTRSLWQNLGYRPSFVLLEPRASRLSRDQPHHIVGYILPFLCGVEH
jgi:hypothetical protein